MHIEILRRRQLLYLKIYSLVVSPCEGYLAGATNAGTVVILKLDKGDQSTAILCEIPVNSNFAYSLLSTAHHLVCGDSRGFIKAWRWENLTSKVPLTEPAFTIAVRDYSRNANFSYDVNSLALATSQNNAHCLYAGCGDSNIYCFDLSCGKLIRVLEGHSDFIHQVIYNDTKKQLFSASEDGFIKIWDSRSSQQLASVSPKLRKTASNVGGDWVGCIAVNPSGDFLAFGGGVQMGIYNVPMASFATQLEPSSLQCHTALFCADKLLFGGDSSSLFVYSVDGQLLNEIPLPGLRSVYSIAPFMDNSLIAVSGTGSKVELIRHFAYHSKSLSIA